MASVEVTIPKMLAELVDGPRSFTVEGETVDGALRRWSPPIPS